MKIILKKYMFFCNEADKMFSHFISLPKNDSSRAIELSPPKARRTIRLRSVCMLRFVCIFVLIFLMQRQDWNMEGLFKAADGV